MKKTIFLALSVLGFHGLSAQAQEPAVVSTVTFGSAPVRVSTPSLTERDYISQIDFEKAMNEAEAMFKNNPGKYKTNYDFRKVFLEKLSENVQKDIKLGDFVSEHPDEAIRLLDKEIEMNKKDFTLYDWRGSAYREKCPHTPKPTGEKDKNCVKSLEDFDRVIGMTTSSDMGPGYIPAKEEAYRQKGMIYERMGENEKALESYEMALKNTKLPGTVRYNMAITLITMGRYGEAAKNLKLFLAPDSGIDKYSKEILLFDPCKKLFEKGYYVEGCPEKELLKKLNSGREYREALKKEAGQNRGAK